MTRHEIPAGRHCRYCAVLVWTYRGAMYATPEAAAHARAEYIRARRSWRHLRREIERHTVRPVETYPQDPGAWMEPAA